MSISTRRWMAGLSLTLLLAAALLVRPARTWVDQWVLARALHPQLRVEKIQFHGELLHQGMTLVQATQFNWGAEHRQRSFGLAADQAWFVVENEPLVDLTFCLPKVVLERSRLYLQDAPRQPFGHGQSIVGRDREPSESVWQSQLQQRLRGLTWSNLHRELDDHLALDAFNTTCAAKVTDWLGRSQALVDQASNLVANQETLKNPLRRELELQARVENLDRLARDEERLLSRFSSIEQLIADKLDHISVAFDQQAARIKRRSEELQADDQLVDAVTRGLIERAGDQVLMRFKPLAEVADLVCRAALRDHRSAYDRDYRRPDSRPVSLSNLSARGVFRGDQLQAEFSLAADYHLTAQTHGMTQPWARFCYQFQLPSYRVTVNACGHETDAEQVNLLLRIQPPDPAGSNPATQPARELDPAAAHWSLASDGQRLHGTLRLDRSLYHFLAEGSEPVARRIAHQTTQAGEDLPSLPTLELNLGGWWSAPTCSLTSQELPQWLREAVRAQVTEQLQLWEAQTLSQLENFFDTEIERLYVSLQRTLDQAQQQTNLHAQQILAARELMQSQLHEGQAVEFARIPDGEVSR